jgi:uncharacterized protein
MLYMYMLVGVFSGLLAGMLGIGGGLLVTPALIFIFHKELFLSSSLAQIATGTSLMVIICNSLVSVVVYQKNKHIDWGIVKLLFPSLLCGAFFGALSAHIISSEFLARFLGIFIVAASIQMQFKWKSSALNRSFPHAWILRVFGVFTGILGGLTGVGGSIIIIPFLTYFQLPIYRAAGTAIACALFVALGSALTLIVLPYVSNHPEVHYIFWPAVLGIVPTSMIFAWIGASVANRLPVNTMKRSFAIFLTFVGSYLVFFYAP